MKPVQYPFAKVREIIEDSYLGVDGEYMIWAEAVWTLAEQAHMTDCGTVPQMLLTYSLITGICRIYQYFYARYFGEEIPDMPQFRFETVEPVDSTLAMLGGSEEDDPLHDDFDDFDEDGDEPRSDDSAPLPDRRVTEAVLRRAYDAVLHDSDNMNPVFALLQRTLGRERTYAILYYCLHYDRFSLDDWENDEFYYGDIDDPEELEDERRRQEDYENRKRYAACEDVTELLDLILSEVDEYSMPAYEWLSQYMS